MKTTSHSIVIDAKAAFKRIGLDLDVCPIGPECVQELQTRIKEHITMQLLADALVCAATGKRKRKRKSSKQSGSPTEPQTGGPVDEK